MPNRGWKSAVAQDQPQIALADQVLEDHSTPQVIRGDRDDQSQVRLDQAFSRDIVAGGDCDGERTFPPPRSARLRD